MLGLAILLLFNLLGFLLHRYAHVPLPENVLGMLLLFLALVSGLVKLSWVAGAADLLLRHMMLFFVPVIVAVLPLLPVLAGSWLPVTGGLVVSTLATMTAAAWLGERARRKEGVDEPGAD